MLLVHQAGSVRIGEVFRYTVTYTPAADRILPTPSHLHLKVKNTSAIPLRAAWLHGPYALHIGAYPATFNPHQKVTDEEKERFGIPDYEPMLKAGGSWTTKLTVPGQIRETGADLGRRRQSDNGGGQEGMTMTWIVEIHSQILFSATASVNFEVLIGRDERSLDLGFAAVAGHGHGAPGQIREQQASEKERRRARRAGNVQTAGVYSKAVQLVVEDTDTLWDKPALPALGDERKETGRKSLDAKRRMGEVKKEEADEKAEGKPRRRKKIHLVVLTHGLHSNLGADMLFLKESIDATVAQARVDAKKRKANYRKQEAEKKQHEQQESASGSLNESTDGVEPDVRDTSIAPLSGGQEALDSSDGIDAADSDSDDEQTIVRGFTGNAVRTEKGIQYLGKRLAKYILRFTYPDQPFLPVKKPLTRQFTDSFKPASSKTERDGMPSHQGSSIHHPSAKQSKEAEDLPYTFTSISFVGHSLGGLIQTYAVAYIHKHSPSFFQQIQPVNFICLASPMLGLSNENPLYVKFALDFGLVGRTGQDLGLSFRPTTFARGGWNAVIGGLGGGAGGKDGNGGEGEDPSSKPLLRILPTGPAHQVLKKFRNRTLYSNVVNDGIVPLRTSCLLFLDWRGLGKVEKARRENGLIGTALEWGWAELTGANSNQVQPNVIAERFSDEEDGVDQDGEGRRSSWAHVKQGEGGTVPQPAEDETAEDNRRATGRMSVQSDELQKTLSGGGAQGGDNKVVGAGQQQLQQQPQQQGKGAFDSFLDWFRPTSAAPTSKKTRYAMQRGQTMRLDEGENSSQTSEDGSSAAASKGTASNPTMRPHPTQHHSTLGGGGGQPPNSSRRPIATKGESYVNNTTGELQAPPKTSIFESAGDILHPPLPSKQWITDPSSRSRTIFHDRVYHPDDIPPPPSKRPGSRLGRTFSSDTISLSKSSQHSNASGTASLQSTDTGNMKVEEKIARAYHRDLTWRKVLVRMEPDAHNNMIVRRMFANAYGWPVVKHLCDTHFSDTEAARVRDEVEPARERARPMGQPVPESGEEVEGQTEAGERTKSEAQEARDGLVDLKVSREGVEGSWSAAAAVANKGDGSGSGLGVTGTGVWDDSVFEGEEDDEDEESEEEEGQRSAVQRLFRAPRQPEKAYQRPEASARRYQDGHRGLMPVSPTSSKASSSARRASVEGSASGAAKSKSSESSAADNVNVLAAPVVAEQDVQKPGPLGSGSGAGDSTKLDRPAAGLERTASELVTGSGKTDGVV
ncbi:hypothetical protein B0A50_08473 [Salinomyces thailandicus]|uniref:DUF676 domain-containing protein n=1 Tax=Salinomyces thailandicus TaxID=706561 RepID=A0A4U0TKF9_9PEZI|nr:hypothetical protein B0A50_08473 [Salinomyces thailandica]